MKRYTQHTPSQHITVPPYFLIKQKSTSVPLLFESLAGGKNRHGETKSKCREFALFELRTQTKYREFALFELKTN